MFVSRNLKKAINLTGKQIDSGGAFCSYFKYNNTHGIKVLYSSGHKSIKALRNSQVWRRATKENTLIRKCKERYNNIPAAYGVFPVKIGRHYYPGIAMQHISGIALSSVYKNPLPEEWYALSEKINKALIKCGIYHDDLHRGNILLSNGQYYVIDFTYDLVWLDNGFNDD